PLAAVVLSSQLEPLSLHDALPISRRRRRATASRQPRRGCANASCAGVLERTLQRAVVRIEPARVVEITTRLVAAAEGPQHFGDRSEEHTSELQSRENLVCRLLLEK